MNDYRVRFNPQTGLPVETKLYTLWKIENFLGMEYLPGAWEDDVGRRYDRSRAIILYALHECQKNPATNRHEQLKNTCRKYLRRQPSFWPRFLREKYPAAQIEDYFSVPHEEIRAEFIAYEALMEDAGGDPAATGKAFDVYAAVKQFTTEMKRVVESSDMEAAIK